MWTYINCVWPKKTKHAKNTKLPNAKFMNPASGNMIYILYAVDWPFVKKKRVINKSNSKLYFIHLLCSPQ